MIPSKAQKLAYDLRRQTLFGRVVLRADVVGDRIVFSGGRQGSHSIDIGVSSQARVLAHWEGYCENNGMPAPKEGATVKFIGNTGKLYKGIVTKLGTKRAAVDFHYRHGGKDHANVPLADLRY